MSLDKETKMKMIIASLLLCSSAFAAPEITLSRYRVNPNEKTMLKVADAFEVERKVGQSYEILVPSNRVKELKKIVPFPLLLKKDINPKLDSLLASGYRSLPEVYAILKAMAEKYPRLVQLVPYGKSKSGKELLAVKFSDNVKLTENEPQIMITAATHGDELITVEVLLNLMQEMLNNYPTDKRISSIINGREIFFIPVVNVDGFSQGQRYDGWVDPNRSYPYPGNMKAKPTPSIAALIDFFETRNIKGSLDLHAFGELIMYPWAYTYDAVAHDDELKFYDLTRRMAETNHYTFGPISKVIYVAKGSSADYYYLKKKTTAIAIEMGQDKVPPSSKIPEHVDVMREPIYRFLESF
jgi:predicted deacylase